MERQLYEEFDQETKKTNEVTTGKRSEAKAGFLTKGDGQRIPASQNRSNKEKNIEKLQVSIPAMLKFIFK